MNETLQPSSHQKSEQIVVFRLGEEHFAIPIIRVKEIVKKVPITIIPQTPSYVAGVMNLRGTIIPVVDLRLRLGFPGKEGDKETRIILVQLDEHLNGLIVDGVSEVTGVDGLVLQPPSNGLAAVEERYIEGIYATDGRLIIQLDIDEIIPKVS